MTKRILALAFMSAVGSVGCAADLDFAGIFPESVKTVYIVAPCSQPPVATVRRATNELVRAGYRVKVSQGVWKRPADGAQRARYLEEAWQDPETDLVLCACGGKGGYDTATNLNYAVLRARELPFVGFSNASCLMNAFIAKGVRRPISGPMCTSLVGYPTSRAAITRLSETLARRPLAESRLQVLRAPAGVVSGLPAGGHWPSLSRMDPAWLPSTDGRIVFLEINANYTLETAKKTFRDLCDKGFLAKASALVLGDLGIRGKEPGTRSTKEERCELAAFMRDAVTCPVFLGYPYGHRKNLYAIDYARGVRVTPDGVLTWDACPAP